MSISHASTEEPTEEPPPPSKPPRRARTRTARTDTVTALVVPAIRQRLQHYVRTVPMLTLGLATSIAIARGLDGLTEAEMARLRDITRA